MHDLTLELIVNEIFGESLTAPAERQQQQERLDRLTRVQDEHLERGEIQTQLGPQGQRTATVVTPEIWRELDLPEPPAIEPTFTKGSATVSQAKQRFVNAVDRFIAVARGGSGAC